MTNHEKNGNKTIDTTIHIPHCLKLKPMTIQSVNKYVEELKLSSTATLNVNQYNHVGEFFGSVYQR